MGKKTTADNGTSLVIVESPTKARTISRFLGNEYVIEASIGHIRDLPEGAKEIPEQYKKENWAYLGVNVEQGFEPVYVIPKDKTQQVRKLKNLLKDAKDLYLATDEDREGEAISWHLCEVLKPRVPVKRLVFHEITKEAILDALKTPREIDEDLVRAQEARRIIDRLYGYEVSPLLWRKVRPKLSAGRVQSVAVRLIVERERQRMAFHAATYWDLVGTFATPDGQTLEAELVSVDGRRVPASRDFDPDTGKLKDPSLLLLSQEEAGQVRQRVLGASCRVSRVEDKPYVSEPYPPFTTSTLQQEANRKYGFTARRTMQAAQSLYENGHITYMRTDSTNLATVAIETARELVRSQYGADYVPAQPRIYVTKVKNAQEAHEAIRPAGHPFDLPDRLRPSLGPDEFKLYDLIWKRTMASQMANARGHRVTITIDADGVVFQASGKSIDFPGYLRAYVEGADDPEAELADQESLLPVLSMGAMLAVRKLEAKSHTTQPPARYTEASLTRKLEKEGIGRPSTYASIIDTILARNYVFKRGNALVPTWVAFAVCQLLEAHLPGLVDYRFTAAMEDELDAISRGEMEHVEYLRQFYYGHDSHGLKDQLKSKIDEIDARDISRIPIGQPEGGEPVFVRVGRYGPFIEQGARRASIAEDLAPDELTLAAALDLLDKAEQGDKPLGMCPETGKPIYVKVGRFGPYVQRGNADDDEKPQNASLLKGMRLEDMTVDTALKLLSLPRTLGPHPESAEPVTVHTGRFGPFVRCGDQTRSLGSELSPLDVSMEQALELLAQPKAGRGAARRGSQPVKVFGPSPVTGEEVKLMAGRYGPYVTDGQTNATVPRGTNPEELTLEQSLELLAERAARGPAPSRRGARARRPAAATAAAAKRPAKKTAKKKVAKKKAARKKSSDN